MLATEIDIRPLIFETKYYPQYLLHDLFLLNQGFCRTRQSDYKVSLSILFQSYTEPSLK